MKALLIIDMQIGSFKPATPRFNTDILIYKINKLAAAIRENGNKVIFIQHDGSKENNFIPNSSDWEILSSLIKDPEDLIISKTANDPFYESDLQNTLDKFGIKELVITGCATDYCVDTAVRSALSKDFKVIVVKDGHTTADRPHLKAEKVIEHHNWIWENMTPTKGNVAVVEFEKVIEEFKRENKRTS